jgi:hypothetical protein
MPTLRTILWAGSKRIPSRPFALACNQIFSLLFFAVLVFSGKDVLLRLPPSLSSRARRWRGHYTEQARGRETAWECLPDLEASDTMLTGQMSVVQ